MLETGEVVEIGAVLDRRHRASGAERTSLVRDRLGCRDDRVRIAGDQGGDAVLALLLDPDEHSLGPAVLVGDERIAQVRHPARSGRALHRGTDEMDGAGWGGRQHDVDPLAARDPDRGRDRGQVPGHVLVGEQQPPSEQARLGSGPLQARLPVQLVRRQATARTDVARAVNPCLGRRLEVVVAVYPLRVVRGEHVGLDPERGQVRGRLQRALHAAAAGGREVEGDDQDLHRGKTVEDVARIRIRAWQVELQLRASAVDDEPSRAVAPRDRQISGPEERERIVAALVRAVRLRVGDVTRRCVRDVDGGERGDPVARRVVREDDRPLRHLRSQSRDESRRQLLPGDRPLVPVREAVQRNGQHDERGRQGGDRADAVELAEAARQGDSDGERGRSSEQRDPRREREAAPIERIPEVAGIGELKGDACAECDRQRSDPQQAGEDGCTARDGEAEGDEPGRPPHLRDRDGVGETGEERRHEHQYEDGEEAAEHEGRPASLGGEYGERNREEGGDRDGAGAREDLRGEPVASVREDVELPLVVAERPLHLCGGGIDRGRLPGDRPQPEGNRGGGQDDCDETGDTFDQLGSGEEGPRDDVAAQRDQHEEGVGRVHERERPACDPDRGEPGPRPFPDVGEEEGDHHGNKELAGGGRRQRERRVRAAATGGEREHPNLGDEHGEPAPDRAEDLSARLPGDEKRGGHEHARLVEDDRGGVHSCEPGDEREEGMPEWERVPGVEAAVAELVHAPQRQSAEVVELANAGEMEEVVPSRQVPRSGTRARSRTRSPRPRPPRQVTLCYLLPGALFEPGNRLVTLCYLAEGLLLRGLPR